MRTATLILFVFMMAACQSSVYPENFDHGSICYDRPYADAVGLVAGERGWVVYQMGLTVRDAPQGEIIARLDPGDSFTVLDGPGCWHVPPTSNNRIDYRIWRIQSDSQGLVGWVNEYGWSLVSGITYFVEPLTDDQTQLVGLPLDAPVVFSGELQWTSINGPLESRLKTHGVTFDHYGYVDVAITADDPGLVNPDVFADDNACRVVVLISPTVPLVSLIGNSASAGSKELEHLWVRPGDYAFEVSLRFMPGAVEGAAPDCQDTGYTLTITPV
jgi:hypothetical protein